MEHEEKGHSCSEHSIRSSVHQTLDELDFERGIWSAALNGELGEVERHLSRGENVNKKDKSGYTALHYASRNGHLDVVRLLVESRADTNAMTSSGNATPLHRAAYMGNTDIVSYLLAHHANPLLQDADGMTPLHKACGRNHAKCVDALVKAAPAAKEVCDIRGKFPSQCASDEIVQSILR